MSQFTLSETVPGLLRATFSNPPRNFLDSTTLDELEQILARVENNQTQVLVLDAADPDFFMARYDAAARPATSTSPWAQLETFATVTARLEACPTISIAAIRGRTRGGGSELALACDMRFASLENAIFGQPEVPFGVLPAGGGIERLTKLTGRARALEIIATGDDFDAATAERYGWINRAVPDNELDTFVDRIARRIASFDREAVTQAKRLIGRRTSVDAADQHETITVTPTVFAAASAHRRTLIRQRADAAGGDFELDLGNYLGPRANND